MERTKVQCPCNCKTDMLCHSISCHATGWGPLLLWMNDNPGSGPYLKLFLVPSKPRGQNVDRPCCFLSMVPEEARLLAPLMCWGILIAQPWRTTPMTTDPASPSANTGGDGWGCARGTEMPVLLLVRHASPPWQVAKTNPSLSNE